MLLLSLLVQPAAATLLHAGASPELSAGSDTSHIIGAIIIKDNKVTNEKVILRELLFRTGDTILGSQLDNIMRLSELNLVNTTLFNFVTIEFLEGQQEGTLDVEVRVTERWYIWPIPAVKLSDRNFNVWWETRDLRRLSYGLNLEWMNFRGRRETLIAGFMAGYNEMLLLEYRIPYLNRKKTLGLGFGGFINRNRQLPYMTVENKQVFIRDNDDYVRRDVHAFVQFLYRQGIYNSHLFELKYDKHLFSDTLHSLNPYYSDGEDMNQYFTLYYKYKSDYRDYRPYPLSGHYFDLEVFKYGLGFFGENSLDFMYIKSAFRKYWKINRRFYYAFGLSAKFSNGGRQPYYNVRGIGYGRDLVRSYEYYLVDGQHFIIWKNNLKFALLPRRDTDIGFIKSQKFSRIHYAFYLNLIFDLGFVSNEQFYGDHGNRLENELLLGYGLGLDFVTYYDIVIRMEISVNRAGEPGFFLHFMAPI